MTLRDWLTYQGLLLKSALGILPPPPAGKHVHQCPKCKTFWVHEPGARDEVKAHTCPQEGCGAVEFWPYVPKKTRADPKSVV